MRRKWRRNTECISQEGIGRSFGDFEGGGPSS
jgi:hypothetical protein